MARAAFHTDTGGGHAVTKFAPTTTRALAESELLNRSRRKNPTIFLVLWGVSIWRWVMMWLANNF